MILLDARVENGAVFKRYSKGNTKQLISILRELLEQVEIEKEKLASGFLDCQLKITAEDRKRAKVQAEGSPECLFFLINTVIGQLNKGPIADNLLDSVQIRADYVAKYQDFAKALALKHAGAKEIGEEVAKIDKDGNLVISISIDGENHSFKVPPEAWE